MSDPLLSDDDELDGCDLDFVAAADDDLTASLRALFPEGNEDHAAIWRELFPDA